MRMLIEHTAFHGFDKTLKGMTKSQNDRENFLQVCTQIVFSDEIILSTALPSEVIDDSRRIKEGVADQYDDIFRIGVDDTNISEGLLVSTCQKVADTFEKVLTMKLRGYSETKDFQEYMPRLSESQMSQFDLMTKAIERGDRSEIAGRLAQMSLTEKDDGLLAFILCQKPEMIDSVIRYAKEKSWNFSMTSRLISDVRFFLNSQLAKEAKVIYTPSYARAREISTMTLQILQDQIQGMGQLLQDKTSKLLKYAGRPRIILPNFKKTLIGLGYADPKAILEVAFDLRKNFKPLRDYLKEEATDYFGNGEYRDTTQTKINDIAESIFSKNGGYKDSDGANKAESVIETGPVPNVLVKYENSIRNSVQAFVNMSNDALSQSEYFETDERLRERAAININKQGQS